MGLPQLKSLLEDGKVAKRIANIVILAEDREQQNLIRRYLERCGQNVRSFRLVDLPARSSGGSGEKYVRDKYSEEVKACRSAIGRKTSALLIVMVDADLQPVESRQAQLNTALASASMDPRDMNEPIVVLIPKRHVETWIRALLGNKVDETTDYTIAPYSRPTSTEIKNAAHELHRWTRPNAQPGETSPPSLTASLPEWRKIPS